MPLTTVLPHTKIAVLAFLLLVLTLYIFFHIILMFYHWYVEILILKSLQTEWLFVPVYINLPHHRHLKIFYCKLIFDVIVRDHEDLNRSVFFQRGFTLALFRCMCLLPTWDHFNLASPPHHSGSIILNLHQCDCSIEIMGL